MIYVFEGFEEDKRILVEKMDNEITITTKTNSKVERMIKKSDDFISENEFECYCDDVIQELLFADDLILVKTLK